MTPIVKLWTEQKPASQLVGEAFDAEIEIAWQDGQVEIEGPQDQFILLDELNERRDELVPLLRPGLGESVCLGKFSVYPYQAWSGFDHWPGEQLRVAFALDTETTLVQPGQIPDLVMAAASDGQTHLLIHPADVAAFLKQHASATIAAHNAGFDFCVLQRHLRGDAEAQQILWRMADEGRLRDTMLLDGLYQLGKRDAFPRPKPLDELARYYSDLELDKNDPCRTRYGSIQGLPWDQVPRMFFDYAIGDAIATFEVYEELLGRTRKLIGQHGIDAKLTHRFGHLTEQLQVRGAIGLAAIERNGLNVDRHYLDQIRAGLIEHRDELLTWLDAEIPGLIPRDAVGELIPSGKTGAPKKSNQVLLERLEQIAQQLELNPPRSEKRQQVTTSRDFWQQYDSIPFVANWVGLEETNKLLSFFAKFDADRLHPRYNALVRTGRTSSYSPNIQQLPRQGNVREGIVASPRHSIYAVDYSFIELRTLAVVCESRYGFSRLGQVIREGIDPHQFVADMIGCTRQEAKVINFGFPGGLGLTTFVQFAKLQGIELTIEQAKDFRDKLLIEVFPELSTYLSEDTHTIVARQLNCEAQQLRQIFRSPSHLGCMRRIISGETTKADSTGPYDQQRLESVWHGLQTLNRNPELQPLIVSRDTSEEAGLARKLFGSPVMTLTGRVRGRVSFTAARNTPFQGLAADGAKAALYRLVREGYRVIAFIHDEFLIELSDDADWRNEPRRIDAILCDEMSSVCNGFPIAVEGIRCKRWSKNAAAVYADDGTLLVHE